MNLENLYETLILIDVKQILNEHVRKCIPIKLAFNEIKVNNDT